MTECDKCKEYCDVIYENVIMCSYCGESFICKSCSKSNKVYNCKICMDELIKENIRRNKKKVFKE